MRRSLLPLVVAAVLAASQSAKTPAEAAATKGPEARRLDVRRRGPRADRADPHGAHESTEPTDSAEDTTATEAPVSFELFKGNKYAADGATEKAKYVYKVGQQKLKFKTGALSGSFYGTYDKETRSLTLHAMVDDSVWASCTRDEVPEEPATTTP